MSEEQTQQQEESKDEFGTGIFDQPVNVLDDDSGNDDLSIELTDREIAIAEGRDPDEEQTDSTPAEDQENSETENSESEGDDSDDSETTSKGDDWFSESDRRLAAKYGMNEEDLQEFGSASAMYRAIDVIDRKSGRDDGDSGRSSGVGGDGSADAEDDATSSEGAPDLNSLDELELIDLSAYENYEPEDKALAEHLNKTQAAINKINKVVERFSEVAKSSEAKQIEERQRQAASTLGNVMSNYPEVYGDVNSEKVSSEHAKARKEVAKQAEIIYSGYLSKGEEPELEKVFEQAIYAAHGSKLKGRSNRSAAERKSALQKQSNQRRSPGRKSGSQKRTNADSDDPSVIANDREVVELFDSFQVENGA